MAAGLSPQEELLRRAQIDAERVVALLRMLVALALWGGVILAIDEFTLEAQPYLKTQIIIANVMMGSYFLLGAVSFLAVRAGVFRRWMIWFVATADCGFLILNTWLSLKNTSVPGDMLFLMPAVWLAPLVLAFSVLRFNPRIQAYSVALIVAGLASLCFVVEIPGDVDVLPRIETALAAPPNLIRLFMVFLAGMVLVFAAFRTNALLRGSIAATKEKAYLTRYLPRKLVEDLTAADPEELRNGQLCEAAILFADIRGFTRWAEGRAPEEIGAFITEFRERVEHVTKAHGGVIDKYIGDAAMVLFMDGSVAERGLACGNALLREITLWSELRCERGYTPVRIGIGLHQGEVLAGVVGTEERLEYTVLGDTVNIASRLQERCKQAEVDFITSETVLDSAAVQEGWHFLRSETLRGRVGEIRLYGLSTVPENRC